MSWRILSGISGIMAEKRKIKVGVVGVGYLGEHHTRIYSELDGCEMAGIYDTDEVRAQEISDKYGCKRFGSVEELAVECEAVSVVVPTDGHCGIALDLFGKGCHLLIEKPLCTSLDEAEKILSAAKNAGSIVQVGHVEHYNPVMAFLEKTVDRPKFITAERLAPFNPRGTEVGVVLDLMIHDIGIILELVKAPIRKIDSVGVAVLSKTEDIANARITFEDGCVANINTSRVSLKKVREIRVFQPRTYLSLDFMNQKGHLLQHTGQELEKKEIPIEKGEPLMLELSSFLDCVSRYAEPKVGAALGKSALEVAIQITEQINAQQEDYSSEG